MVFQENQPITHTHLADKKPMIRVKGLRATAYISGVSLRALFLKPSSQLLSSADFPKC